jgi:hypothetical protein
MVTSFSWCGQREWPRGALRSPEQGWKLAFGWYRDKRNPVWRRHTVDETEALLAT